LKISGLFFFLAVLKKKRKNHETKYLSPSLFYRKKQFFYERHRQALSPRSLQIVIKRSVLLIAFLLYAVIMGRLEPNYITKEFELHKTKDPTMGRVL
jgi:hypothetical protein